MIQKLKNKVTTIISSESCAKSVTIYYLFKTGSRNEQPSEYGMAHFLEHMFFKGTCNRPEAKMIASTVDKFGGVFNAFTSRDITGYYIKLPPKYLETAIDILSDMILNSTFDPRDIKTEKDVVINELKMRASNPAAKVDQAVTSLMFKGTGLEHPIGGSKSTVCTFNREKIATFLLKNYVGSNLVISIAGKIKPSIKYIRSLLASKMSKSITNRYKNFLFEKQNHKHTQTHTHTKKHTHKHTQAKKHSNLKNFYKKQSSYRYKSIQIKDTEHTFITLAFPTIDYSDPLSFVLEIISIILAGNMSSRLFIELREKKGLVYNVSCNTEYFEDTGSFSISCSTFNDKKSVDAVIKEIADQLIKIKKELVNPAELKRAIDYTINSLDMKQENTDSVALNQACEYIYLKKTLSLSKIKKLYSKITPKMIMKAAKMFFIKKRANLVILSQLKVAKPNLKLSH